MKAIVVFLAKQKNYGRVLIMQQCPPNSGGQAISEASFVEEGKDSNGSEPFGLFKFGKSIGGPVLEGNLLGWKWNKWRLG